MKFMNTRRTQGHLRRIYRRLALGRRSNAKGSEQILLQLGVGSFFRCFDARDSSLDSVKPTAQPRRKVVVAAQSVGCIDTSSGGGIHIGKARVASDSINANKQSDVLSARTPANLVRLSFFLQTQP